MARGKKRNANSTALTDPETRKEIFMAKAAGLIESAPSVPYTREERYWLAIIEAINQGGAGDMKIDDYDPNGVVAEAGGIPAYVSASVNSGLTEDVTYYVNKDTGDDSNDGKTESTAKKTIMAAVNLIPKNLNGHTATIDVAAKNYKPETVTIDGFYNSNATGGVRIGNSQNNTIIITDIVITNNDANIYADNFNIGGNSVSKRAVTVMNSNNVTMRNITVEMSISDSDVFYIFNCKNFVLYNLKRVETYNSINVFNIVGSTVHIDKASSPTMGSATNVFTLVAGNGAYMSPFVIVSESTLDRVPHTTMVNNQCDAVIFINKVQQT